MDQIWFREFGTQRLVGFLPAMHRWVDSGLPGGHRVLEYLPAPSELSGEYSMLCGAALIVHRRYITLLSPRTVYNYQYNVLTERTLRRIVEDRKCCDDTALSIMMAHRYGVPPVYVRGGCQVTVMYTDWSHTAPLSYEPSLEARNAALSMFVNIALEGALPFISTTIAYSRAGGPGATTTAPCGASLPVGTAGNLRQGFTESAVSVPLLSDVGAEALYRIGAIAFTERRWKDVVEVFYRLLRELEELPGMTARTLRYHARYGIAVAHEMMATLPGKEILLMYAAAVREHPLRPEAPWRLSLHYYREGNYRKCFEFAEYAIRVALEPSNEPPVVMAPPGIDRGLDPDAYSYGIYDQMCSCAYYVQEYLSGLKACEKLVYEARNPREVSRYRLNYGFYVDKVQEINMKGVSSTLQRPAFHSGAWMSVE